MQEHKLEKIEGEYRCTICLWRWKAEPKSVCPGVPRIHGEHLLTYTQLQKKHLKPTDRDKPDACYYQSRSRVFIWLYDERKALPRRKGTEAQKAGRARAWATTQEKYRCPRCKQAPESIAAIKAYNAGGLLCNNCAEWEAEEAEDLAIEQEARADYRETSEWATALLQRDDWCIIDTETTDLSGYLVEIAVIAPDGRVLFQSVVNPQCRIHPDARRVHQIGDEEILLAPTLPEIWPELLAALDGRRIIVTFNADFDKSTIDSDATRYGLTRPKFTWQCLMLKYAAWCGNYSKYWGDYERQRLPNGSHRALGDALAALELIKVMALHLERASQFEQKIEQGQGECKASRYKS